MTIQTPLVYDSTLTSKGQTTIPAEVRERLNMKAGDKIRYIVSGDRVYFRVKNKRAADLVGRFHDASRLAASPDAVNEVIAEAIVDHVRSAG